MFSLATAPHSAQPIDTHQQRRLSVVSREAAPLFSARMKNDQKIRLVLHACARLDRRVKKDAIALIRKLIAIKHLFPAGNSSGLPSRRRFDLDTPIQCFNASRIGIKDLLHEISPALTEDEHVVDGIRDIVNESIAGKHDRKSLRESITPDIARAKPRLWPSDLMLNILKLGDWDEILLRNVSLPNADLRGVHWPGADLRGADLEGADITNGILSGADLAESNIENCIFYNARLDDARLNAANADRADFRKSDLTSAKAIEIHCIKAKFGGANVTRADFTRAHLSYSSGLEIMPGVLFTGAEMHHVNLVCNMDDAILFEHLDDFVKLQLHTLSTLSPSHARLHNEILRRMIEITGAEYGRLPNIGPLANTLLTQKCCWSDERLKRFIDVHILPRLLAHWNLDKGNKYDISPQQAMTYIVDTKPALDWPKYCGATSQMLVGAEASQNIDRRNALCRLLRKHPTIRAIAEAVEHKKLGPFEDCSVFIASNFKTAIVYANSQILKMSNRTGSPYDGHYFLRREDGTFIKDKQDTLPSFGIIRACAVPTAMLNIDPPPAGAIALLTRIFGNDLLRNYLIEVLNYCPPSPGHADHFQRYLGQLNGGVDLLTDCDPLARLTTDQVISVPYCRSYWKKFVATGVPLESSDDNIARMLLSMSVLFYRYASADLLGHKDSHAKMLRTFGTMCVVTATIFDMGVIDLKQRGSMRDIVIAKSKRDPALATCFNAIFPQAWLSESDLEAIASP